VPTIEGSEAADTLIGTEGRDILYGHGDDDALYGLAGDDELYGGDGDDLLEGGEGNDRISGGNGTDTASYASATAAVRVNISSRITSYQDTGGAGFDLLTDIEIVIGSDFADTLTGDEYRPNWLDGGAGDDTLVGDYQSYWFGFDFLDGGPGADFMAGSKGVDHYVVDNVHDTIIERADEGDDIVFADVTYTLAAGVHVETVTTTWANGWKLINLTGNELPQSLYGNDGWNELNGSGGNDYLVGGGGADLFLFITDLGQGNIDGIGDFEAGLDRIGIDNAVFTGLDGGILAAGAFAMGSAANEEDDRIIYDPTSGALWFDEDGSGPGAALQFAQLETNLSLCSNDFVVV